MEMRWHQVTKRRIASTAADPLRISIVAEGSSAETPREYLHRSPARESEGYTRGAESP
jgi:hypothetical protein